MSRLRDKVDFIDFDAMSDAEVMERCRAARAIVDSSPRGHQNEMELEAFMAIFHPKEQRDRKYMRKLHEARRGGRP